MNTHPAFVTFMFLQLFFGGMVMPPATGIMLNQVPQNMRTVCNSIANICYNLFGYVPAPYIYGFMYQRYGQGKSHAGLYTVEFFGFMSFVFSLIVLIRKKLAFREFLKSQQLGTTYGVADMQDGNNTGSDHNYEARESDIEAIDVASNSE
jgi:MFS family permease